MNFANVKSIAIPEGNVKQISVNGTAIWKKEEPVHDLPYLCFTAVDAGATVGTKITGTLSTTPVLEYSTDGRNWSNFALGTGGTVVTLSNAGDKVWLRGNNNSFSESSSKYISFSLLGRIEASGNVMSLLDKTCEMTAITIDNCYSSLFRDCTSLTTAPELPATTLANYCYTSMFYGCTSLTTAPELPATTLANYCYRYMFRDCTSLNSINVAFSSWSPTNATSSWVNNVKSTGTFTCPASLPNTRGTSNIPSNWTKVDR